MGVKVPPPPFVGDIVGVARRVWAGERVPPTPFNGVVVGKGAEIVEVRVPPPPAASPREAVRMGEGVRVAAEVRVGSSAVGVKGALPVANLGSVERVGGREGGVDGDTREVGDTPPVALPAAPPAATEEGVPPP